MTNQFFDRDDLTSRHRAMLCTFWVAMHVKDVGFDNKLPIFIILLDMCHLLDIQGPLFVQMKLEWYVE